MTTTDTTPAPVRFVTLGPEAVEQATYLALAAYARAAGASHDSALAAADEAVAFLWSAPPGPDTARDMLTHVDRLVNP